jgi:hypothetical protein
LLADTLLELAEKRGFSASFQGVDRELIGSLPLQLAMTMHTGTTGKGKEWVRNG